MSYLKVVTFKQSQIFGNDFIWSNVWVFDAPYESDGQPAADLAYRVQKMERQIHQSHVQYREVVVKPYDDIDDAQPSGCQVLAPIGTENNGQQATPGGFLDPRLHLYIRKEVQMGRLGKFMFRGVIDPSQVATDNNGTLRLLNVNFYRDVTGTWLDDIYNHTAARLVVGQGVSRYGAPYLQVPCIMLQPVGVSWLKASPRKLAKGDPKGRPVFSQLEAANNLIALAMIDIGGWLAFNHDFVPTQAKEETLACMGAAKAASEKAKNYANDQQSNGQAGNNPPAFRYPPGADTIMAIDGALQGAYVKDTETLSKIQPYVDVSGDEAHTHADTETMQSILIKYESWMSAILKADWLNPANQNQAGAA